MPNDHGTLSEHTPPAAPTTPTHSSRYTTPQLGDFSKLGSRSLFSVPATLPYTGSSYAERSLGELSDLNNFHSKQVKASVNDPVRLGNFSKIFGNLLSDASAQYSPTPSPYPVSPWVRSTFCSPAPVEPLPSDDDPFSDAYQELTATDDTYHVPVSDSDPAALSDSTDYTCFSTSPEDPPGGLCRGQENHKTPHLSYRLGKYGPIHQVHNPSLSASPNVDGVSIPQLQESLEDKHIQSLYPAVAKNGIYIFLDVSNIQISFFETLKNMHGIHKEARLVPLPKFDLTYLTNILVRDRHVESSWAACSTLPDTPEPQFVRELRKLDYEVLLRERKRSGQGQGVHYVEDCVDEALHLRIGETYMERGETPGTIVIATGDAKPAPFSLGFLKYAEWMLKAGWNVEVVSWSTSLSSAWRNPVWRDQWGSRFRIIDLDPFLSELWIDFM